MAIELPDDYWIEIPGGRYTVGLLPGEAKRLAEQSAEWFRYEGPTWSINDNKLLGRHLILEEKQGNPEWVEAYLLAHFPAREVELAPFAIAKYPVTNDLYRRFMAETGEFVEPSNWPMGAGFADDDRPPRGIAWMPAVAFAEWADARLPFEDEWERAVRGPDRWLFPWGNDLKPLGWDILEDKGPRLWTVDATRTPEGVCGALIGMPEWCADSIPDPPNLDRAAWGERVAPPGGRGARGGMLHDKVIPSGATRRSFFEANYVNHEAGIRLVRADERRIPPSDPEQPVVDRQWMSVRVFEVHQLRPAYVSLLGAPISDLHETRIADSVYVAWPKDQSAANVVHAASRTGSVRNRPPDDSTEHVNGLTFVAISKESFRRNPPEHGVFAFTVEYRFAEDGRVMARGVSVCRMAFDKELHRMVWGFRRGEQETPLDAITVEMIQGKLYEAFDFYDRYADGDRSPFLPARM